MHILSTEQLTPEILKTIFDRTDEIVELLGNEESARSMATRHAGQAVCTLFYESSTRTRLSFERAADALGVGVISTENAAEFSSASKGETIEDTARVLDQYHLGAIIMRHPVTGMVSRAAAVCENTTIINAGDGKGEHPTQSLLDARTIYQRFGRLDNLKVVMGGDLANGRTVKSLAKLLANYDGNEFVFVSTPEFQMTKDILDYLKDKNIKYSLTDDMHEAFKKAEVVYWVRLQRERISKIVKPDLNFVIDQESMLALPEEAIVMHPLPRVGEIDPAIDSDERAWYFRQAQNGLYVRAALLDLILDKEI